MMRQSWCSSPQGKEQPTSSDSYVRFKINHNLFNYFFLILLYLTRVNLCNGNLDYQLSTEVLHFFSAFLKSNTNKPCPTPAASRDFAIWKAMNLPSSLTTGFEALYPGTSLKKVRRSYW